jgi:hypothetical protein
LSLYVMTATSNGSHVTDYFFTGPFTTETHARVWAVQQKHEIWRVIDLADPGADPVVLAPAVWTIKGGHVHNAFPPPPAGQSAAYILCFNEDSYRLIGPLSDIGQCEKYLRDHNLDDDPRWYGLLLSEPPRAPRVEPAPPIPAELIRQYSAKQAKREALAERLWALG